MENPEIEWKIKDSWKSEQGGKNIQISNPKQIKIQFLFLVRRGLVIKIHIDNRQVVNFPHCYPTQDVKKVTSRNVEKQRME